MVGILAGARRLNGSFCEYLGHFVFGCTGIAMGVTGAAIPAGIGAIALAGMFAAHRKKKGDERHLEDDAALKAIIDALADEWREDDPVFSRYTEGSALTRAQDALVQALPECDMSPARLAEAATDESALPFPERATQLVLEELAANDPATYGAPGDDLAKAFAEAVISKAFSAAVTNRAYFERFQPYLLIEIARTSGEGIALQKRALDALADVLRKLDHQTALLEAMDAKLDALAAQSGTQRASLPQKLLDALAERADPKLNFEDQVVDLIARYDTAQVLIHRGHSPSNLDEFVQNVLKRMADKAEAGDLDGASKEADDAFAQWEREEADRQEAAKRGGVAILRAGIDADIARGDSGAVARKELQRIAIEFPEDQQLGEIWETQGAYEDDGQRFGRPLDLQIVRDMAELRLAVALDDHEKWGALIFKGNALQTLGERGQQGALEEAVTAFRAALTLQSRDAEPMNWAVTQNNLGNVLQRLGELGQDGALNEAVSAYRAALTVYTKDAASMDWAMTQNNLGAVLRVLGSRGQDRALEEAAAAYRAALTVYTEDNAPMDWAMTQNNLGNVLSVPGKRGHAGALDEAVSAYRAALTVYTEDAAPMAWATTLNNLGNVLRVLGERGQESVLEEAAAACRAALTVRTKDAAPMDWAATQNNLGNALQLLGERGKDGALEEAETAYCNALSVYTQDAAPVHWAETAYNLSVVWETMADVGQTPLENLQKAIDTAQSTLDIFEETGASHHVSIVKEGIARMRENLASLD